MTQTMSIEPLLERLLAGETLDAADRTALLESRALLVLGMAADTLRRRRHGDRVTFVRVAAVTTEQAAAGNVSWEGTPGEVRLVGRPADAGQLLSAARTAVRTAGPIPVTGFSLADLVETASSRDELAALLRALREAGLAEIADAPIDALNDPADALGAAGDAGLPIARLSVDRAPADRAAFFDQVSALLSTFPGIAAVAPLPSSVAGMTPTTGYEDVHMVALARLLLPVAHIQVDWARYGPKLAQVALTFGADDLDGVSPKDHVVEGRRRSPLEEVRRNIQAASSEPVERGPFGAAR